MNSNEEFVESIIGPYEQSNGDLTLLEGKIPIIVHFQCGSRYLQNQIAKSNPKFIQFLLNDVRLLN